MKQLLKNIWTGRASSVAVVLGAGLTYALANGKDLPEGVMLGIGIVAAILGAIAGPIKPTK